MTKMPTILCSWCGTLPPNDKAVTAPCFDCRQYALKMIAASQAPADCLRRAEVRYSEARSHLIEAKRKFRKARKAAKREGLLR